MNRSREAAVRPSASILATVLVALASVAAAQETASGDLVARLDAIIAAMPAANGGGHYQEPDPASRDLFREVFRDIEAGLYADAHARARTRDYRVVLFTDTAGGEPTEHVILQQRAGATARYWGTYVFNLAPVRANLAIQSPHPRFDTNTGYQSVRAYLDTGARACFLAGTHRCSSPVATPCDGLSGVCSQGSERYRISDMAHAVEAIFHVLTEELLAVDPELVVIQPHGFAMGAGDPYLIMSNGTRFEPTGPDHVVQLRDALLVIDPVLTAKIPHVDHGWTRLIGTTNTQGRLLNDSDSPCDEPAITATGRFIHIEQSYARLRDTAPNRDKLAEAIMMVFPEAQSGAVADEPAVQPGFRILGNFANPFGGATSVRFELDRPSRAELDVYDLAGRRVARIVGGPHAAGVHEVVWSAQNLPSGTYVLRLRADDGRTTTRRCVVVR